MVYDSFMMDLRTYIEKNEINVPLFADELGVTADYLYKILRGERRGSLDLAFKVQEKTRGVVPAESFRGQ
jgi:hypothetical protein